MTRPPFGFGSGGGSDDEPGEGGGPSGDDPFGLSAMFGGTGGPFGGDMGAVFAQMQRLMSWTGGPVNWDLATEVATGATRAGDRAVTSAESREIDEACRLADLWLDPVTTLPATSGAPQAWTRTGWVESTLPSWRSLVDPVAGRVVAAMGGALEQGLSGGLPEGAPPELAGLLGSLGAGGGLGPLQGVMGQVGGFVFGAQVGQALGALAGEVLSSTEVGLPLSTPGRPAVLPANLAAFSQGLEVPADEVRLYVCLRELAHQRLFASVPWLTAHLFDAVDAYARGIEVDSSAIERAMGTLDPSDPESMQRAVGEGLFELEPTPVQQAALARLETALALVEGWVDAVVDAAAADKLPSAAALRETLRRRRASGGPAEQTFATLVGLQLRPRRLREAAALWAAVAGPAGAAGRDALWAHPDLLPSAEDLDDPAGFVARSAGGTQDWDAGLRDLDKDLDGTLDADATGGPDGEDGQEGPDDQDGPDGPAKAPATSRAASGRAAVRGTAGRRAACPPDRSAPGRPPTVRAPLATVVTLRVGLPPDGTGRPPPPRGRGPWPRTRAARRLLPVHSRPTGSAQVSGPVGAADGGGPQARHGPSTGTRGDAHTLSTGVSTGCGRRR